MMHVGMRADIIHFLLTTLCGKSICARTFLGESNQNASIRQICLLATSYCITKATKDNGQKHMRAFNVMMGIIFRIICARP
jgi:hypothetical protein